ncbi:hypothetical protein V6N13_082583 [Hibiscus sabdariffa]
MVTRKKRIEEFETAAATETCLALMHNKIPAKKTDPGSFTIECFIGHNYPTKALCDPGAGINLMPKSVFRKLGIGEAKPTTVMLQLADHSYVQPEGKIEDILVQVDKFIFPTDFLILDCEADVNAPIILGRPFLATGRVLLDFGDDELILRVDDQQVRINVIRKEKCLAAIEDCKIIKSAAEINPDIKNTCLGRKHQSKLDSTDTDTVEIPCTTEAGNWVQAKPGKYFEPLNYTNEKSSVEQPPKLELKTLPEQLKYVYLGINNRLPVIISSKLQPDQEEKLITILRQHRQALGWSIVDIKGISPAICMHKILLEENHKPTVDAQRRLNQAMKDVKGGITVISNEKNELIPSRTVTGWRVCMDYMKLNKATRKDHFPLPFIDQMLDRLAGKSFYCFLDGYSGYNQIAIAPEDQSKTTFTCPYGTFAFRRMPFGLCNTPATFQRCMTGIFSDMNEDYLEIFMDDFSTFGDNFDSCLSNLEKVLARCEESNLVLNWEKCHFMVDEGIVLGHKIYARGIEVDRAKIDVISKLPPPTIIKGIRSFLGHAGFYRRFIENFSKITKPLCSLLEQGKQFEFDEECIKAFETLKSKLVTAPIVEPPDWTLPFELMCDASDYAAGAVLGQRKGKIFHPIYYARKTLNDAQVNYTTTEKELLAVIFAFDKFRSYLLGTKVTVYTDHSAIKYLLSKKDAKPRLIRWILLLQEFDVEIIDRKGTENQVADQLSRLENKEITASPVEIKETFPDEQLLSATSLCNEQTSIDENLIAAIHEYIASADYSADTAPWYADYVNYIVSGITPH